MRFKLLDFYGGAITKVCIATGQNGNGYTNATMTFEPGKIYETKDPTLMAYIEGKLGDVNESPILTDDLATELQLAGVKYTTKKCGTCVSAKTHAVFNPFVIVEEEEEDNDENA